MTATTQRGTIDVQVREVYGNRTVYPVCPTAQLLAQLAGTRTLTPAALRTIEQLGFTVRRVSPNGWRD